MEVMVGSGLREARNLPGEHRPPQSWKGRKRCPTRSMSGNCEEVGGTPMIARLTRSSVCLLWSSRCLIASLLVRSFTVRFCSGVVVDGEFVVGWEAEVSVLGVVTVVVGVVGAGGWVCRGDVVCFCGVVATDVE